ncbi:hypothetical protein B0H67DRAFT_301164 [Lasiosphaeris hirsuta]|uniref:Uncharacterized protein n=1 Tax=Lasiosphaeris hirsuta TaxID=260670 RepID=A0AA40A9L8_9PEZI|nr:hypothetical protein B0H67DRAFT_301164 [Lasiosphaeris hirsuta]
MVMKIAWQSTNCTPGDIYWRKVHHKMYSRLTHSIPRSTSIVVNIDRLTRTFAPFNMNFEVLRETLPGANVPPQAEAEAGSAGQNPRTDFAWLESIDGDNCAMPLDHTKTMPTKSLDFGRDGVTGSVSAWHELLQMTAPDNECGVIFVRGDFPDSPDSILARAQRRNQRGLFGLEAKIDEASPYVLEPAVQSLINMRWPYTRFNFVRQDLSQMPPKSIVFGHQSVCSFVKEGTLYQIMRITPAQCLRTPPNSETSSVVDSGISPLPVTVQVGGMIRMGCANTCVAKPASKQPERIPIGGRGAQKRYIAPTGLSKTFRDRYFDGSCLGGDEGNYSLSCESESHGCRLELRLWVDGKPTPLTNKPPLDMERTTHVDDDENEGHSLQHASSFYAQHQLDMTWTKPVNIIATFSLIPKGGSAETRVPQTEDVDPDVLTNYLGVWDYAVAGWESWTAPYRLWSLILGETPKPSGGDPASFCLNTVGRCLEEVLGVLTVPVPLSKLGRTWTSADVRPVALVQNIVTCQSVDLASALWHIRLIIRAYDIVSKSCCPRRLEQKSLQERFQMMKREYVRGLEQKLRGIFAWILWLSPTLTDGHPAWLDGRVSVNCQWSSRPCRDWLVAFKRDGVHSHHRFYCTLIIWYMMKNAPFVYGLGNAAEAKSLRTQAEFLARLSNSDSKADTVASDDAFGCILRWYHSHCIMEMAKTLSIDIDNTSGPGTPEPETGDESVKFPNHQDLSNHWRAKAGKVVRLYGQGRFAGQNIGHEIANMASLRPEIGAEDAMTPDGALPCLEYIKELVGARRETEKVELGAPDVQRWDASHSVKSAMPRPAPWELSCLGHHLPVNLDVAPTPSDTECMKECGEFLLADHTFIPSWDHSLAGVVGLWWDLTTSSIIAAKTLESYTAAGTSGTRPKESSADVNGDTKVAETTADGQKPSLKTQEISKTQQQPEQMQKEIAKLLDRIWRGKEPDDIEGFDWRKRRPRLRYHADSSVQSLEDTPQVYQLKQTKDIKLRPHLNRLIRNCYLPEPDWTLDTIGNRLVAGKLRWVSCIDYVLGGTPEIPEVVISSARGRAFCRWNVCDGMMDTPTEPNPAKVLNRRQELWDLFFLGTKDIDGLPGLRPTPDQKRFLGGSELLREDFLNRYRKSLFRVLHDSIVDLGTKYRIIFAKSMPPITLQAAVYMWHPEGIDTFDDHLGSLSHFSDSESAGTTDEMWLTSITLAHWRPQSELESKISAAEVEIELKDKEDNRKEFAEKMVKEKAKEADRNEEEWDDWDSSDEVDTEAPGPAEGDPFPPASVKDLRVKGASDPERDLISSISEQAISLVITGDGMGSYWTCSLVCDLMDEGMMARYAAEVQKILQHFIHQQYTGRALVFSYLLGEICRSLSLECERFMSQIDQIMGLQVGAPHGTTSRVGTANNAPENGAT